MSYAELERYHTAAVQKAFIIYKQVFNQAIKDCPPPEGFHYVVNSDGKLIPTPNINGG